MSRGQIKLYANRSGEQFAQRISKELSFLYGYQVPVSPLGTEDFADGEVKTRIKKSNGEDPNDTVTGRDVYLVQSCFDPTSERSISDNFFEFLITIDALKRSGANKITAVLPFHPFCRQDRHKEREPLTARLAINLMERAGVNNVITCDMHSEQLGGFFDSARITNLKAKRLFFRYLREYHSDHLENLAVIPPDVGASKRGEDYAKEFKARVAQAFKVRPEDGVNKIEKISVKGDIEGRNILVPDDMVDTAGTIEELFNYLRDKGVMKSIVCCTHALLNGPAIERIRKSNVILLTTDSIPRTEEFKIHNPWYKEVSLAPSFAQIIYKLNHNQSLS
jgi:ribose-phosphate pyrophosphokinase